MSQSYQIQLTPAGGGFECRDDQTVLEAALAAGYWLPHSCRSGSGACCQLTLESGEVSHRPLPEGASPVAMGECRTCLAIPHSDLRLTAPGVPAAPGQRVVSCGAKVVAVERPSADVTVIRLQLPVQAGFSFRAGQYADVLLKDGARRSYSMANPPEASGLIEWHVRRMEGGRFSTHAYDKLKPGALLRVEGPFGDFVFHEGEGPVVLLASGTGYAPIAALLKTHGEALARRGAVLYWGGRRWEDLYAVSSVADWEAAFPGVRLVPVLSEAGPEWQGRRGFVHQAVLEDQPDLSAHEVYACGNPLMVDAARSSFVAQGGLPAGHFYADAFVVKS